MPALDATLRRDITVDVRNENKTRIIVFMVVFSALTSAIVALRIASKLMQWGRLAWDDRLLLASLIQMLSMNILFVIAIPKGGLGRHTSTLTAGELAFFKKSYFVAGLVMPTCYATAKLSMLWLLYSVFSYTNFQKVLRALAVVVVCWWLATMLLDTFICFPINARWNPNVKGKCSNKIIQIEYFATPIPWIITDFAILIAPLPVLWTMKIPRARQFALMALFGIGIATCAVACKRYVTLLEIHDDDLSYSMVEPCIWTIIESSTTIICAALPASMHVLRTVLPTEHIGRIVERIEEKILVWRHGAEWRGSGEQNLQLAQDLADSPPANLSTRRLEITPI